ncbi:MAG: TolC family protein [Desulfobacterales bacterium]
MHACTATRRFLSIFCVILTLAAVRAAAGQELPPLSLQDAIDRALKHNPQLTAAHSRLDAGRERVSQARAGFLPRIDFEENYNRTTNPTRAFGTRLNQEIIEREDFEPDALNDPDPIDNFSSRIRAEWLLYDSGRTLSGYRQARFERSGLENDLERSRQEVIYRTIRAYDSLLMAMAGEALIDDSLASANANLKTARSRFRGGFVVRSDVLRAEVRVADLQQAAIEARGRVVVAKAGLNSAMGDAIDADWHPVTPLAAPVSQIAGDARFWEETALENQPLLRRMELAVAAAREEVRKSQSAHLPAVGLAGDYEVNTERFDDTADNYTVGAFLRFNLFAGGRLNARTREAKAWAAEADARLRSLEDEIRVEARSALQRVKSAEERIAAAEVAVRQAEAALGMVSSRYGSGLVTIADLLDAETAHHQAKVRLLEAVHDCHSATAGLMLVAGTLTGNFSR